MTLSVVVNSMVLSAPWARGRRTLYAGVTVGPVTWWVQRWDTERAPRNRILSADRVMGWT